MTRRFRMFIVACLAALCAVLGGVGVAQASAATASTGGVSEVTPHGATIEGVVSLETASIEKCFFEYGAGLTVPCNKSNAEIESEDPATVTAKLEGLEPVTAYPYKLVIEVEGQKIEGATGEFTTAPLATVTTEGPSNVTTEGATLNGTITPHVNGTVEYFIEYGREGEPLTSTTPTKSQAGEAEVSLPPVAEPVAGLEPFTPYAPFTPYQYQLVAVVEGHTIPGGLVSFNTLARVTATTNAATEVTPETATLNGTVDVNAGGAHYYFEYGVEGGAVTTTPELPIGEGETPVTAPVTGLEANRPYQVRLVAISESDPNLVVGNTEAFTTTKAKPIVLNSSAGTLTRTTATISAEINPENDETGYNIEYEAPGIHVLSSPHAIVAGSAGPAAKIVQTLEELKPATTYTYRIVAGNGGGTTVGGEGTFTTGPSQPASVESESAQATSQTTATIEAKVNPNGLPTIYALEVGTEIKEGSPVYIPQSFGQVGESGKLTFTLTNLLPGTVYHYRIVASNAEGDAPGADATFATPSFISPIAEPAHQQLVPFVPEIEEKPLPVHVETRAQKLAKALHQCTRQPKKKRAACRRKAEKKFGAVKKKAKKK